MNKDSMLQKGKYVIDGWQKWSYCWIKDEGKETIENGIYALVDRFDNVTFSQLNHIKTQAIIFVRIYIFKIPF